VEQPPRLLGCKKLPAGRTRPGIITLASRLAGEPPYGVVPSRRGPSKPGPRLSGCILGKYKTGDDRMPVPGAKNCWPGEQAAATGDKGEDLKPSAAGGVSSWTKQPVPMPAFGKPGGA